MLAIPAIMYNWLNNNNNYPPFKNNNFKCFKELNLFFLFDINFQLSKNMLSLCDTVVFNLNLYLNICLYHTVRIFIFIKLPWNRKPSILIVYPIRYT